VLALAKHASRLQGSPIERIVPVLLPVFDQEAASNQDTATARGLELCEQLQLRPAVVQVTEAHRAVKRAVDAALNVDGHGWASGQLVAYQRTPALYYATSLLAQEGTPGLLVGTTNEDEGAYLGFFGKASDGLTDIQILSDLSKNRVVELARRLGVPTSILNAEPTGDMYDGRIDEEVFGAPYGFVELFLRSKKTPRRIARALEAAQEPDRKRFALLAQRLEELHAYNHHKYLGRSPAVHLDVFDVRFPGSWNYSTYEPETLQQLLEDLPA
jgi:NAD+ synthase (glutamine-hydrolysing)